jgi:hypothetical protein
LSTPRVRIGFALLLTLVVIATVVLGIVYGVDEPVSVLVLMGVWAILGAAVVALRPANGVGWLFLMVGLWLAIGLALTSSWEHLGAGDALTWVTWFSEWFWIAGFAMMIATLFVIPTGRLPSRGWWPVLLLFEGAALACTVVAALEEEVQVTDTAPLVRNPIGIAGLGDIESYFGPGLIVILVGGAVAGAVSLIVRYRHGGAVEREQLKLLAVAAPLAVVCIVAAGISGGGTVSPVFWDVGMAAIPVAVTVAILRYRLFDVDLLISRTLVYGSLTVLLGLAYAALVLAGQALFSSFAGGSDLAIAVSTLVVAALFLPLRARLQRFVDRRFYRRRYDAARTLEAFGARLRSQVELDELRADLQRVVAEAMQPAHVSVWLRGERSVTIP